MAGELTKNGSAGERFTGAIMREFGASTSTSVTLTEKQKRLAQHLFVKLDVTLKTFEMKREGDKAPFIWNNVNMEKLAMDAMHRIELGLDALIPNHLSPIPYFNNTTKKYDIDLRIGFVGKDYYRRSIALVQPKDIVYELVHESDKFVPKKKSLSNAVESYEFEITAPFNRGKVVGGFGYIMYEDATMNKLVIVTNDDFEKAKKAAASKKFWDGFPTEMKYKTLVHRVTEKIIIDPSKVNISHLIVENQEAEEQYEDRTPIVESLDIKPVSKAEPKTETKSQEVKPEPKEERKPDF